jgi:hypothetical protein
MNPSFLSFYPKFLLSEKTGFTKTPKAQIFDTTPWVAQGVALANVAGVILSAKRQGVSFYANADFNNPDVTLSPAVNVKIDLQTDDKDEALFGEYEFEYKTRVYNELIITNQVIDAISSSPVTSVILDDIGFTSALATNIVALVALLGSNFKIEFLSSTGVVLGSSTVTGASFSSPATTITCSSVALASYASVTQIRFVTYYEGTEVVNYCAQTWPDAVLTVTGDCIKAQIQVQDETQYLSSDSNSRIINFNYPVMADGTPVDTAETTTAASLLVGPNIWTGSYTISLTTTIERDNTEDALVLNYVLTKFNYFILECDAGLCCMKDCIKTIFNKFKQAVQNATMDLPTLQNNMITILAYVQLYTIALNCGDTELAGTYLQALKDYLTSIGCECDCQDSSDSNEPTIVYPMFSEPIPNYVPTSYLELDNITINSNVKVPTNKAVITYVAAEIAEFLLNYYTKSEAASLFVENSQLQLYTSSGDVVDATNSKIPTNLLMIFYVNQKITEVLASTLPFYLTISEAASTYMVLQPFVSTNTVSGDETVTLNAKSGIINYTPSEPLFSGELITIIVTNSQVALTNMVVVTLDYDLNVELVIYSIEVLAGSFKINLKNIGASSLDDTIKIRFITL